MTPVTEVRWIDESDWQVFRNLRLAALADAPRAFGSTHDQWRDAGEQRWRDRIAAVALNLVAEHDAAPVGMVSGTGPDPEGTVELISMWVAPAARQHGVGAALVNAVVAWAQGAGGRQVVLQVTEVNREATRLYRRHGFVPTGEVETRPHDGVREVQLALPVSPRRR